MKTSIVILTHNQLHLTKLCLNSIRKHTPEPLELIVVDNGSTDGTVEYLRSQSDIKLIGNAENAGFPKRCNQGLEASAGENVLFLRHDTVVTEHWLDNMLNVLYSNEKAAMVGPVSNRVSGSLQIPVAYGDLSGLDAFARAHCQAYAGQTKAVRRLDGFCLLVKRSVLNRIGWFDEQFESTDWEADDLYYRTVMAGYALLIAMDAYVHHAGHGTFAPVTAANFGLLQKNRQKAMAKWGKDIHAILVKPVLSVSLCMIVRNEEEAIGRCLDSVKHLVDEIVIVDTGSTDRTKEIVSRYTDRIYDFEWVDDFAAARNYAFSLATRDYIFWLDADDVLTETDQRKFAELKLSLDPNVDSVTMNYHLAFDAEGNVTFSLRRNRLVKRAKQFQWFGAVHEYLQVGGRIINSDIAVTHLGDARESDRNLRIYENRLARGESFSPRDWYYYANELNDHRMYDKAAAYYEKFLETKQGWVEDVIAACGKLSECYHLLGDEERSMAAALQSFAYDVPRPEMCCKVGFRFMDKREWRKAIFWFELATKTPIPENSWGPVDTSTRTWMPHLQLCVCFDRLGEHEKAFHHHKIAQEYRPNHPSIQYNERYFASLFGNKGKKPD